MRDGNARDSTSIFYHSFHDGMVVGVDRLPAQCRDDFNSQLHSLPEYNLAEPVHPSLNACVWTGSQGTWGEHAGLTQKNSDVQGIRARNTKPLLVVK